MKKKTPIWLSALLLAAVLLVNGLGGAAPELPELPDVTDNLAFVEQSAGNETIAEEAPVQDLPTEEVPAQDLPTEEAQIDEMGWFYSAEFVSLYLQTYGKLPDNFLTKEEARKLGWEGGSVEKYAPGYAIGGDKFGNREGLLPTAKGRQYYECDIDTDGKDSRGAKRIVFSNDGLIYYTEDHYESFELLFGEE